MTGRGGYDDGERVVEQAARMTRIAWTAIAGVTGLLGIAVLAAVVLCLAAAVGMAYVVAAMH
ncbi:hypothetical protein ACFW1F_08425 [Streptomyces bungoensis]|uniref:hypothetical protein n=1 Tax=Streptomyces bungoensis TaxID=285568 RepID=UPI00342CC88A